MADTNSETAAIADARRLLHHAKFGVLSTLSLRKDGWPFGSIVPYALDRHGQPILLIASIAEHTKNIRADDRVSILVHEEADGQGDIQAHGRLTIMGRATAIGADDLEDARSRYLARVPDAAGYFATHDFFFHHITLEHVRFIGGFGKIYWLDAAAMREVPESDPLAEDASGIITHMNEDHGGALKLYCQAFKGIDPGEAAMVGVDQWGFDVVCREPEVRLRFDFDEPATTATIRKIVVDMVQRARAMSNPA